MRSALDALVEWYVANMAEHDTTDAFTSEIAREHGIPVSLVEKVRRRFECLAKLHRTQSETGF